MLHFSDLCVSIQMQAIMMEVGRWGSYPNSPGVGGRGRSPLNIILYFIICKSDHAGTGSV